MDTLNTLLMYTVKITTIRTVRIMVSWFKQSVRTTEMSLLPLNIECFKKMKNLASSFDLDSKYMYTIFVT
jgi:hypothetical protein